MPQRNKPSNPSRAPVQAVLFDAYGTLFDVYSVATLAEQLAPGRGNALAELWREKQLDYTRLASMGQRYRPFWEITRASLHYACAKLALDLSPERENQLLNQYLHLGSFPENMDVLRALKARGVPAGILSNGDREMLAVAIKSAGFEDLLAPLISVDAVQRFKPDPAVYALGPQAMGLPARQILFVSSNGWDAIGATWFGYTTLWVNRARGPLEVLGTEPNAIGTSLRDVLDFFPAD